MQDTLADKLKKIRGNESRKAFSLKYGIHEQSLIRYEKGTRIPDNDLILRIANGEGVSVDWLLADEGPMYKEEGSPQAFRRVRQAEGGTTNQHTENIDGTIKKMSDMSEKWEVQRELTEALKQGMEFQKQAMALTQENADLRVQAERHLSRIRDLERENAEIPALKARIAELERELSERPKLPKTVTVDVSAKSKPTPVHGAGPDTAVVPGAGVSGVGALGTVVRGDGE